MKTNFVKVTVPCVMNDVVRWHQAHGFVWDVVEESGRKIGVFYCTRMCGDGNFIHFFSVDGVKISPATVLYTFRNAIRMMSKVGVVFAAVSENKKGLLRVLSRLGMKEIPGGDYCRDGEKILLLKYFNGKKSILRHINH
jgi:hypothetical protein